MDKTYELGEKVQPTKRLEKRISAFLTIIDGYRETIRDLSENAEAQKKEMFRVIEKELPELKGYGLTITRDSEELFLTVTKMPNKE